MVRHSSLCNVLYVRPSKRMGTSVLCKMGRLSRWMDIVSHRSLCNVPYVRLTNRADRSIRARRSVHCKGRAFLFVIRENK